MRMFTLFTTISIFLSCQGQINKNIKQEIIINNYINENYYNINNLYKVLQDTINLRTQRKLKFYGEKSLRKWKIDNLIIFNIEKNKFYTTLNTLTNPWEAGSSDLIQSLYGVKIDGEWHVYLGAQNLIAMRDGYKYDKYEPFTWDEISYVAHEQMFGRYLTFKNGELSINEKQLGADTGIRALTGKSPDEVPSAEFAFKELTEYYNTQIIDSIEYQQLLDEVNNPSPKDREPINTYTWWDRLMGKKKPIFETDEWEEFIAKKNRK